MNGKNLISFSKISILRHNIFISFLRPLKRWNFNVFSSFGLRILKVKTETKVSFLKHFYLNFQNCLKIRNSLKILNWLTILKIQKILKARPVGRRHSRNFQNILTTEIFSRISSSFQHYHFFPKLEAPSSSSRLYQFRIFRLFKQFSLQKSCQFNFQNFRTIENCANCYAIRRIATIRN